MDTVHRQTQHDLSNHHI